MAMAAIAVRAWLGGLGCTAPAPDAASELALAAQRRDVERRMLHASETVVLWHSATDALRERRPAAAAAAVALGLEVDPDRFAPLVDLVADTEDPQALAVLASRVDRERFALRSERADLDARYRAEALPGTLARVDGVDRKRGARVLAGVDAEYVVQPDAARMTDAVDRRMRSLADSPAVRAAYPGFTGVRGQPSGDTLLDRADAAIAAGLPEPIAVAEVVSAALSALDPYTLPVWPASLTGWEEHHAGASVGVGMELADVDEVGVVVTGLTVGGPAWTAGVHTGDGVVAVGGEQASGRDAAGVAALLAGEEGTSVGLTVAREVGVTVTLALTRASIREETVRGYTRADDAAWDPWVAPGVAWIRITAFRPHTDEELDALLDRMAADDAFPPRVVVLDLRGNGGGDVMAAVNVADRFVAHGDLAYLEGRTLSPPVGGPNGEVPWNVAIPGHPLEDVPVVLLVDRDTASAAELVAGALHELRQAPLVGEATYGKGLSQALRVDAALGVGWQVTDGTWLLPSRKALEGPGGVRAGLPPDPGHAVVLSPAERLQVQAMRRKRELPRVHPDGAPVRDLGAVARADLPQLSDDPQAAEALAVARALIAPPTR